MAEVAESGDREGNSETPITDKVGVPRSMLVSSVVSQLDGERAQEVLSSLPLSNAHSQPEII